MNINQSIKHKFGYVHRSEYYTNVFLMNGICLLVEPLMIGFDC